ncbi:uncharacterized protein Z518_04147 [Rhinocladiella mackenziei CBS 650.93]|uniref:Protein YAE1 n=1 Tax=Rhinocladiella mackenziei CBS 650.93 TaxID=1442369 RepID=A0A0D2H6Y5_9EURO|nr:uncharacterized protein Z518_04147 [Rhinocladiella mackenziei CBS 650.93]KIX06173.1 hypothetical protein Z518_04147 [Rhinocladiella mackenziei CBS 650.93]
MNSPKSASHLSSPSTTVTTPEQSPGADDEIWDTSPDPRYGHDVGVPQETEDQRTDATQPRTRAAGEILSDIPTLRRQHMTAGYREGLSVGKAQVIQRGFDEGYPFGMEIGLRVGTVLGVLEGAVSAISKHSSSSMAASASAVAGYGEENENDRASRVEFVTKLYERAKRELKISELMKDMDDEKIAALSEITHGEGERKLLPQEIEVVVAQWEQVVMKSLPSMAGIGPEEQRIKVGDAGS